MAYYGVAIDVGGSKCQLALVDEVGITLHTETSTGFNLKSIGTSSASNKLIGTIQSFLDSHSILVDDINRVVCGMAGAGRQKEQREIHAALSVILPNATITVTHDARIALASGTYGEDGIVCIAGTGSIVYGIANGIESRVGGWGNQLGDEGSGYWLGRQILQAVMRAYDQVIEYTKLRDEVFTHFQIHTIEELLHIIYDKKITVPEIAALSKYAFINDWKAKDIREQGAKELGLMISTCCRKLNLTEPIILQGGLFQELKYVDLLADQMPNISIKKATVQPIGGAIAMLFETPTSAVIENINKDWGTRDGFI